MPRQARAISPSDYYHVIMRGNNRENIFAYTEQKNFFINLLKEQCIDGLAEISAYCIMDNHVHIVTKTEIGDLAKAVKSINTKYAMRFNTQRNRVGHVFQDRFKSEIIKDDKHLLQVVRYVHNNPVKAKMVKAACDYKYSSYNEYINENVIISSIQKKFIMEYFSDSTAQFIEYHLASDDNEYLETKEDIQKMREEKGQEIISDYILAKGLKEGKQVIANAVYLEELTYELLTKSRLSHRQIASLLGVGRGIVHYVKLEKNSRA
ncbi:MAG: REP-associated tyrosine transposase [Bacillota bacterium]